MRAIFCNRKLLLEEEVILDEETTHHLHVSRVKTGEEILVLNGLGSKMFAEVSKISKKESTLFIKKIIHTEREHQLSLAIGLPKKDAFEDIVKISVELGLVNIYPLTTKYSQYNFEISDRIQRIIESAMIQSNNTYLPKIFPQMQFEDYLQQNSQDLYFLNSVKDSPETTFKKSKNCTFLIGPEAGFSQEEIHLLRSNQSTCEIHLPTPILRAPTAVAASAGYLLSELG